MLLTSLTDDFNGPSLLQMYRSASWEGKCHMKMPWHIFQECHHLYFRAICNFLFSLTFKLNEKLYLLCCIGIKCIGAQCKRGLPPPEKTPKGCLYQLGSMAEKGSNEHFRLAPTLFTSVHWCYSFSLDASLRGFLQTSTWEKRKPLHNGADR